MSGKTPFKVIIGTKQIIRFLKRFRSTESRCLPIRYVHITKMVETDKFGTRSKHGILVELLIENEYKIWLREEK